MRRDEFSITDRDEIHTFLASGRYGILGTSSPDGGISLTPVNYIVSDQSIWFHGSREGEKMENLRHNSSVTFSVTRELSFIPSHFTDPEMPCNATTFFQSVVVRGVASVREDQEEKSRILHEIMLRFQPEGGHREMAELSRMIPAAIERTAVVRIEPTDISAKYKLGQNLNETSFRNVKEALENRKGTYDIITSALMREHRKPS